MPSSFHDYALITTSFNGFHRGGEYMPRFFFAGSCMAPDPPPFNWEFLERAAGLTFTEPQRTALVTAIDRYLTDLAMQHAAAPLEAVKQRCESIYKHTHTLINLLSLEMKDASRVNDEINLHQAVFGMFPFDIDRMTYIRQLIQLRIGAKMALTRLRKEGQRGRHDNKMGLDTMIRRWHAVFLQAGGSGFGCIRSGGSRKAHGPLLELIEEAFKQTITSMPDSPLNDHMRLTQDALAQRIIAALKQIQPPQERDAK